MKSIFLAVILATSALAANSTVAQFIALPSGAGATGSASIQISYPCFSGAQYVGTTPIAQPFRSGNFSVSLVPNQGCSPGGTVYTVTFSITDPTGVVIQTWIDTWNVPTGGPFTIDQVKTLPSTVIYYATTDNIPEGSTNLYFTNARAIAAVSSGLTANSPFLGTNGTPQIVPINATVATASLNLFSSSLKGLVPPSGGVATTYLNGAGGFTTPPGTTPPASAVFLGTNGGSAFVSLNAATATAALNVFSSGLKGLVPPGGSTPNTFLAHDGTWALAGASPGGSQNSLQTYGSTTTLAGYCASYDGTTMTLCGVTATPESLTDPNFNPGFWDSDGRGFVVNTGSAVYTDTNSFGTDELFQTVDSSGCPVCLAVPFVSGNSYSLSYTVSAVSLTPPACVISGTYTAGTDVALTLTVGAHAAGFTYNGGGYFDVVCTSAGTGSGQTVTFTSLSIPALVNPSLSVAMPSTLSTSIFSATSGNSSFSSSLSPAGFAFNSVQPTQGLSGGNLLSSYTSVGAQDGLTASANYFNQTGQSGQFFQFTGFNQSNGISKDTLAGNQMYYWSPASGQGGGYNLSYYKYGNGDALGFNCNIVYGGIRNANGDEGAECFVGKVYDQLALVTSTITAPPTTVACDTTLTGNVDNNTTTTSTGIVVPLASTGCPVGSWINIDPGVNNNFSDTIQIQAVSAAGTSVSGFLKASHSSGAVVKTAVRIPVDLAAQSGWGQGGIVVDNSQPTYTTGTAATTTGSAVVTGIGTSWSVGMVGGNTSWVGCFREIADDETHLPYGAGSAALHSWIPILSVDSSTQITLVTPYQFTNSTGAYAVGVCGRIGSFEPVYFPTTMRIGAIVLEYNTMTWLSGDAIEFANPYFWSGYAIVSAQIGRSSKFGQVSAYYDAENFGYLSNIGSVLIYPVAPQDSSSNAMVGSFLTDGGNVTNAVFTAGGKSVSAGQLILATTYPGDSKKVVYQGVDHGSFYPDDVNGFTFDTYPSNALRIYRGDAGIGLKQSVANLTLNRTINWPDASGTPLLAEGGAMARTFAGGSVNSVDIGCFNATQNMESFIIQAQSAGFGGVKTWIFNAANTGNNIWYLVPSFSYQLVSGNAFDFALNAQSNGSGNGMCLRLIQTLGTGAWTVDLNVLASGYVSSGFVPSTATATVTPPTASWPDAVITTANNKLLLTNASGITSTIDPTSESAAHTYTFPNISGVLPSATGTPTVGNAVCWKTATTLGYCSSVVGVGGGCTCN